VAGEKEATRAVQRLMALRAGLDVDVRKLLRTLSTTGGAVAEELQNVARIRTQVVGLLRIRGVEQAVSIAEEEAIKAATAQLKEQRQDSGPVATTTAAEAASTVEVLVEGQADEIAALFDVGADAVAAAIDRGVGTGMQLDDLVAEVEAAMSLTWAQASAVVDSAVMAAARQVTVTTTEAVAEATGEEIGYLYDGPDDKITRPFCAEHLGNVYTLAALDRLDNGQIGPVSQFAGGYNCRHRLSPIPLEQAKEEGYRIVR
jgi:hypothetical protein